MCMMTNKEIYEIGISKVHSLLANTIEGFSDLVIQLSMTGEFSDVNDLFKEGEDLVLSVGDFLNSTDENVQGMITILNCLRDLQDSINNQ